MDYLLASYASSDDEEEQQQQKQHHVDHVGIPSPSRSSYVFSSLPQPKSSSFSSSSVSFSLPPPKSHIQNPKQLSQKSQSNNNCNNCNNYYDEEERISDSSSNFNFTTGGNPKTATNKVVAQIQLKKPPSIVNPSSSSSSYSDDKFDEVTQRRLKEEQSSTQTPSSVKSFLSSIPAPKNSSLGGLGSGGRRSIIHAVTAADVDVHTSSSSSSNVLLEKMNESAGNNYCADGSSSSSCSASASAAAAAAAGYYGYGAPLEGDQSGSVMSGSVVIGGEDTSTWSQGGSDNYGNYENYGSYGTAEQYHNNNWFDGSSMTALPGTMSNTLLKTPFKRGRNEIPTEIVEVKQDELMKNRPREDQVKLTGIAFGPSYQPASTKGKPTKLHKRKHQIGSLYFDMKQKEMELSERRAKGFLTKAETQAKYGW